MLQEMMGGGGEGMEALAGGGGDGGMVQIELTEDEAAAIERLQVGWTCTGVGQRRCGWCCSAQACVRGPC